MPNLGCLYTRSPRLYAFAGMFMVGALSACVDGRIEGMVGGLAIHDVPEKDLEPGQDVRVVFQALDDGGKPLAGASIELVTTNAARLTFFEEPGTRLVVMTEPFISYEGAQLAGSVVVQLAVPENASEGTATLIASVEGERGANPTTRYLEFRIVSIVGMGGQGGMGGGNNQ